MRCSLNEDEFNESTGFKITMEKDMKKPLQAKLAYQKLRDMIISGEKLPGTRLMPLDLETEFGIGRVPIREALLELGRSGLVLLEPYKGAIVSYPPTIEEIQEIFEIRFMLEGKAAEAAVPNVTEDLITDMENLHEEMSNHPNSAEPYYLLNRQFHMALYQRSGLEHLVAIINQLIDKVLIFRIRYPIETLDFQRFNRDHRKIIDALYSRDERQVKEITVANVRSGFETLVRVYNNVVPRKKS